MKTTFVATFTIFLALTFGNCIPDDQTSQGKLDKLNREIGQLTIEGAQREAKDLKNIEDNLPEYSLIKKMELYKESLRSVISRIANEWRSAIKYEKNFSDEVDKLVGYLRDAEYYVTSNNVFSAIREQLKEGDKDKYKNTYELYAILSQLKEMTEKPSGSYMTYLENAQDLLKNFTKTKTLAEMEEEDSEEKPVAVKEPAPEVPEKVEEPEKPNPKIAFCQNLEAKLKQCLNEKDIKEMGVPAKDFMFHCFTYMPTSENANPKFFTYMDCFIRNDKSECPDFKKCYAGKLAEKAKAEKDAKEAEKDAKEAERKAAELAKTEFQKKPYFKTKQKFCSVYVQVYKNCFQYAYEKRLQEEKVTQSDLVNRCIYNDMEYEPEESKWKNWAFCYNKTGGSCKQMNSCLEQVSEE